MVWSIADGKLHEVRTCFVVQFSGPGAYYRVQHIMGNHLCLFLVFG